MARQKSSYSAQYTTRDTTGRSTVMTPEEQLEEGKRRQAEAVAKQEAVDAASKPTPSSEELDKIKLGIPVELEPSGLPVDTSIHPVDAWREAAIGAEPGGTYRTRDSSSE